MANCTLRGLGPAGRARRGNVRLRRGLGALLRAFALSLAVAASAQAQVPVVGLRVGSHPDHGRLVLDCPRPMDYRVERDGTQILLRFPEPAQLRLGAAARSRTRNLGAIREEEGAVVIEVTPGTILRHFRLGNRIVLDLVDGSASFASEARAPSVLPLSPAGPARAEAATPPAQAAAPVEPARSAVAQAVPRQPGEAAPSPPPSAVPAAEPSRTVVAAVAPALGDTPPATTAETPRPAIRAAPMIPAAASAATSPAPPAQAGPASLAPPPPQLSVSDEALGPPREEAERDLRQLGYVPGDIRPMRERDYREAVRTYQRRIGEPPTGALTYAQGERLRRAAEMLTETRITAGSLLLTASPQMVVAAGTWSLPEGQAGHPVNRSSISCARDMQMCFEAAAHVVVSEVGSGGVLSSQFAQYGIVAWLPEVIVAERNLRCVTRVLVLRPAQGRVSLADRPHPRPQCRSDPTISPGISQLISGMEPIARFYDARRADAVAELGPAQQARRRAALDTAP